MIYSKRDSEKGNISCDGMSLWTIRYLSTQIPWNSDASESIGGEPGASALLNTFADPNFFCMAVWAKKEEIKSCELTFLNKFLSDRGFRTENNKGDGMIITGALQTGWNSRED